MERVIVDMVRPQLVIKAGNKYMCSHGLLHQAYAILDQEEITVTSVLVDQFFTSFELHSD